MTDNIISLRQYIDRRDEFPNAKIHTFCRLMKKVSEAIDKDERNIVRINLDEIKINTDNGEIVLPDSLFASVDDKTVAGFNTGVSVMAGRKSSKEHERVSLALMILGWYANEDGSSIISDLDVLENFDQYMSKVPEWLQDFFVGVFRRMDYETSFADYYKANFTDNINNQVKEAFKLYDLNDDQMKRITKVIVRRAENMSMGGDIHG
ncbi:MAG: hypothetical protein IJL74_04115 [Bacilli bacterium]|nr:hypothetical protein [Bacilli bacterium]